MSLLGFVRLYLADYSLVQAIVAYATLSVTAVVVIGSVVSLLVSGFRHDSSYDGPSVFMAYHNGGPFVLGFYDSYDDALSAAEESAGVSDCDPAYEGECDRFGDGMVPVNITRMYRDGSLAGVIAERL